MEEKISTHDFAGDPLFHNGTVNSALTRIQNTLNYNLKEQYGIDDPEVTEKFMKLHGLSKDHFDFINNFETLVENGISDNSVDTNANKASTSITGFFAEAAMPINKLVGYRYLYRKLKELYGKKRAKFLTGELYDMSLAMADSANLLKPYCYSLNASKLIYEGKPWGTLPSLPPQHVRSYIANLTELIHQPSNHLAGAIAVGSFFLDIAHVMIYREKKTLSDLKTAYRKDMENCLQSFIHSVNHLSRNSIESPFTNISIFDRTKLRTLIGEDNMGWYFEKDDAIDGVPEGAIADAGDRDWTEYVIDIIMEIEDIYMDIMDAGDKCHDGRPITFPVSTVNISRVDGKNGLYKFAEPEFVDHVCKNHDIMRYNIYVSSGQKVASCCASFDTSIEYKDIEGNIYSEAIGSFVEKHLIGRESEARLDGTYLIRTPYGDSRITGVVKLPNNHRRLVKLTFANGQVLEVTPNHKFYYNGEKISARELEAGDFIGVNLAAKEEYLSEEPVYSIEVDNEEHIYYIGDIVTENCRLINDEELFELGGQVNSFGGTSLSLGSHRVVTINMRRISLECDSYEDYKRRLKREWIVQQIFL